MTLYCHIASIDKVLLILHVVLSSSLPTHSYLLIKFQMWKPSRKGVRYTYQKQVNPIFCSLQLTQWVNLDLSSPQ